MLPSEISDEIGDDDKMLQNKRNAINIKTPAPQKTQTNRNTDKQTDLMQRLHRYQ